MRRSALVLVLLLVFACARKPDELEPCRDDKAERVDPTLLAFLSRARAAHHLADQAEASHDLVAALKALRQVTDGPRPPGNAAGAPEVNEVLADTLAREADLESQRGDHDAAGRLVEQGLGLVPTATYFRGHLFEVRGIAEERRAAKLAAEGSPADAAKAKARALEALEEAMRIQAEVISGQRDDKH
jgi:tetratricopeptide (TPR) repeat protein